MYLISKLRIYSIYLFTLIMFIGYAIYSYFALINISSEEVSSFRFFAENFIYFTLILIVVMTFVFFDTIFKSRNIYRELDKAIELSRQGKYFSGKQLQKLGLLGEKIIEINSQLNSLNEMKSLKISSLSNAINLLLEKSKLNIMLLDAQGQISKVSDQLLAELQIEDKDMIGQYAENILENLSYSNAINELKKSKFVALKSPLNLAVMDQPTDVNVAIFPIVNYHKDISGCICVFETTEDFEKMIGKKEKVIESIKSEKEKDTKETHELPLFKRLTDLFREK
jgi:transcriptional regulator with PAS, ATPase and Fis domain